MILTHSGETYECDVAVKCNDDKYIKLYKNGEEIAAFHNISDFSDYVLSGGSFIAPCDCSFPIPLSVYSIGSRTIPVSAWIENESKYCYEIASDLISANVTTCNVFLLFASGTDLSYTATQEAGKVILYADFVPTSDVVIESIQITRA